ncbi:hypothetical protein TNIN_414471 [Trichonephila inaurata madagascariensis]|uniref:Uncharacterized protein n=1 Tax=Trichonephila inaurata madagascariensis TaxID=2747483 RepID=A0A8X6XZ19_9ARAC|nr:hypothetical protein TNIN_414471 [Trichonephila inaurata madagascariensis]
MEKRTNTYNLESSGVKSHLLSRHVSQFIETLGAKKIKRTLVVFLQRTLFSLFLFPHLDRKESYRPRKIPRLTEFSYSALLQSAFTPHGFCPCSEVY